MWRDILYIYIYIIILYIYISGGDSAGMGSVRRDIGDGRVEGCGGDPHRRAGGVLDAEPERLSTCEERDVGEGRRGGGRRRGSA